jgi:DNA-binding MarR family transcriptional regulator
LVELHSHGPQSLRKLADRADLTTSNVGRACAKLADLGLITRRRSLRDPRNPAIATSAKGNRLVESIVTRRRTSAEEILRRIPSRARADVARAMQQFAAAGGALAWRDAFGPVGQSVSRNHPARRAPLADQQR